MRSARISAAIALVAVVWVAMTPPATAKTLVHCAAGSPEGFDPALFTLDTTLDVSEAIYDRLVTFRPGTVEVMPALAESWEISDDGREYTFRLRPDVHFHKTDGFTPTRPLNADDVIFSFERQWKPDHPYFDYTSGLWPFFAGLSIGDLLRQIRKEDDRTIVFVLNRPDAAFLSNLAMTFASVLSKEYADALLSEGERGRLNQAPVGTGPFQLGRFDEEVSVQLVANPDYWNGAPPIDTLVFAATPDSSVRIDKLAAGDCDTVAAPLPADIAAIPEGTPVRVLQRSGPMVAYMAYNTTQPPFDRADVRRALNMAVDRQAIIDAVFAGQAIPAKSPIPPGFGPFDDIPDGQAYDPDAARTLLSEAGAGDLSLTLWALPVPRGFNPDSTGTAAMIQDDLNAIGVRTEILDVDLRPFLEQTADPDRPGAVVLGWQSENGDPDSFLSATLGCDAVGISNRAQWCNPEFETLIRRGSGLTSRAERDPIYEQALAIFVEEAPWLPIAHAMVSAAVSDRVDGFVLDPLGRYRFDTVDLVEGPAN